MPVERRSLRSNKSDDADKQKPGSNSSTANSKKDKPSTARSTSSRSKSISKKGVTSVAGDMSGDKPHINGNDTAESNTNGAEDIEMEEDTKSGKGRAKDGDEEEEF